MILRTVWFLIISSIVATAFTGLVGLPVALPIAIFSAIISIGYMVFAQACRFLPYSWTCDWQGTHTPGNKGRFDGCSFHSECCKCGKEIMQDGQGNWF